MTRGFLYEIGPTEDVRQYVIEQDQVLIGRGVDCDIRLTDVTVSRHHAMLTARGGCRIAHLGGANPTVVNDQIIGRDPQPLADGDLIKIGACSLRFGAPPVASTEVCEEQTRELATAMFNGTLGQTVLAGGVDLLSAAAAADAAVSVVLSKQDEPSLLVRQADRTQVIPLRGQSLTIGRSARCEIHLNDVRASREHAKIEQVGDHYVLRDLGSANGTLVNGAVTHERDLAEGDTIRIGDVSMILKLGAVSAAANAHAGSRNGPRIPVVLIPGMCGTELIKDGIRLWPNVIRAMSCSEESLADYWGPGVEVGRVVRQTVVIPGILKIEAFGRLVDFLCQELGYTEGVDLLEFGYDWRQDNRTSAARLKERVASWRRGLPDPNTKIIFVAHSMGGLLCRYYLEHLGGNDASSRLILLGTPNHGSARIFSTALSGRNALALPIGSLRIRRIMLHFASLYQLLPTTPSIALHDGTPFDPYSDDGWIPAECRKHLAVGKSFIDTLAATDKKEIPTTCVFGYGQKTLAGLRIKRDREGAFSVLDEIYDGAGDDAVSEASAVLDRAEIHPVRQRHGALYADKDVQRRLRYELLERRR